MSPHPTPAGRPAAADALETLLRSWRNAGKLKSYVVNGSFRREYSSVLMKGLRHTKAPEQSTLRFDVTVFLEAPDGRCVETEATTHSLPLLTARLEEALRLAMPMKHKPALRKHGGYPEIPLAEASLLSVFDQGNAASTAALLALAIDARAGLVEHPRLMSREVHATLARVERYYFDSEGNAATEASAFASLQCVFWLSDTSEEASDTLGLLPTEEDCARVVEEAARNITRVEVRKLEAGEGTRVLLTPKAFLSLLDDLVLPNLEVRAILRKTGAFEMGHLGEAVLGRLSLVDDPHKPYSPFSSIYDTDGTPTRPVTIVENGRLSHPLFTAALLSELRAEHPNAAERFGFSLTGHAAGLDSTSHTNLEVRLEGVPETPFAQAVASAPRVVVVSNLTGMSADPLTGQFALDSDGAKVHEDGALAYSTSLTLRGNILDVLRDGALVALPRERSFNRWAPGVLTSLLSCVPKELAEDDEDGDADEGGAGGAGDVDDANDANDANDADDADDADGAIHA